jgi:hypothetical protein
VAGPESLEWAGCGAGRTDLGHEFHAVEDMVKPHAERHLYGGKEFLEVPPRPPVMQSVPCTIVYIAIRVSTACTLDTSVDAP